MKVDGNLSKKFPGEIISDGRIRHPLQEQSRPADFQFAGQQALPSPAAREILTEQARQNQQQNDSSPPPVFVP